MPSSVVWVVVWVVGLSSGLALLFCLFPDGSVLIVTGKGSTSHEGEAVSVCVGILF